MIEAGWAFGPGGEHLRGKEIGVAISTGGTAASYQPPFVLNDTRNVTDEQLTASVTAYQQHLSTVQPVSFESA